MHFTRSSSVFEPSTHLERQVKTSASFTSTLPSQAPQTVSCADDSESIFVQSAATSPSTFVGGRAAALSVGFAVVLGSAPADAFTEAAPLVAALDAAVLLGC
jgi:hypothetical protein